MFTELVCSITGGPEVMTACALEETRILLNTEEFFYFMVAIESAADHIESAKVRCDLAECMYNHMDLILDAKRCVSWDSICEYSMDPQVKTHRQMQQALDSYAQATGNARPLYFPDVGVSSLPLTAEGRAPTQAQLNKFNQKLAELGLGEDVEVSDVKSADAASRGGGERGA